MNKVILLILFVLVIGLAIKNTNNKPKTISPVETAQATVATPAEENKNRQTEIPTSGISTDIPPAVPEMITVEVRMVGISRVAKPPTNSVQQQANQ
jgi:hypothetical protein